MKNKGRDIEKVHSVQCIPTLLQISATYICNSKLSTFSIGRSIFVSIYVYLLYTKNIYINAIKPFFLSQNTIKQNWLDLNALT